MYSRLQRNRVRLYLNASLLLNPFSFLCFPNATNRKYTNEEAEKWPQGRKCKFGWGGCLPWTPVCPSFHHLLLLRSLPSRKEFPNICEDSLREFFSTDCCIFLLVSSDRDSKDVFVLFLIYAALSLFPVVKNGMNTSLFTRMYLCLWLFLWCSCLYLYLPLPQRDPDSSHLFLNIFL